MPELDGRDGSDTWTYGLGNHNYCRNPDEWYGTDPEKRMERCSGSDNDASSVFYVYVFCRNPNGHQMSNNGVCF